MRQYQPGFWTAKERLTIEEAIEGTVESLLSYGRMYDHWVFAFSGGKDSTALLTVVLYLIEKGRIPGPERMTVLMSDTRQEFPPLMVNARIVLAAAQKRGAKIEVVTPALDRRMYVYMLGRGVPPAGNDHFRWCTRILKGDPMDKAMGVMGWEMKVKQLRQLVQFARTNGWGWLPILGHGLDIAGSPSLLTLTGVRLGESEVRDARISLSCSTDGECGQGWFHKDRPGLSMALAPLVHWRLCHVEDWLSLFAPGYGFDTTLLCRMYGLGLEDDRETAMRTGCAGCMLVYKDRALERIVSLPEWDYLAPLRRLKGVYEELKKPYRRLRKADFLDSQGGQHIRYRQLGPLTMAARLWGLEQILGIQTEINSEARRRGAPEMWLIDAEEEIRILELIAADTWPRGWRGDEPAGDEPLDRQTLLAEGLAAVQEVLI